MSKEGGDESVSLEPWVPTVALTKSVKQALWIQNWGFNKPLHMILKIG